MTKGNTFVIKGKTLVAKGKTIVAIGNTLKSYLILNFCVGQSLLLQSKENLKVGLKVQVKPL